MTQKAHVRNITQNAWHNMGSVVIDTMRPVITSVTAYPGVIDQGEVLIVVQITEDGSGVDINSPLTVEVVPPNGGANVAVTGNFGAGGSFWSGTVSLSHTMHGLGAAVIQVRGLVDLCVHSQDPSPNVSGSVTITAAGGAITWPVPASHNILHMWNQPIQAVGRDYYHEGLDIIPGAGAAGDDVVAARAGLVNRFRVQVDPLGGPDRNPFVEVNGTDQYSHCEPDAGIVAGGIGTPVGSGDAVGDITLTFFSADPHLHFGGPGPGAAFYNPFLIFNSAADRDPGGNPPETFDQNGDGYRVLAVEDGNPANVILYRSGQHLHNDVDLLAEVVDDMSGGMAPRQVPHQLGYWIEGDSDGTEGHNICSADAPYMLHVFWDTPWSPMGWTASGGAGAAAGGTISDHVDLDRGTPLYGDGGSWRSYHHFFITHASSTKGDEGDVKPDHHWRTKAKTGTGSRPNGSDSEVAILNEMAMFPDGAYQPNIIMNDLVNAQVNEADPSYRMLVDNFAPFVKELIVTQAGKGGSQDVKYSAAWLLNADSKMELHPSTPGGRNPKWVNSRGEANLKVTFSEEMQEARAWILDKDGNEEEIPLNKAADGKGLVWEGSLSKAALESQKFDSESGQQLLFSGKDLAENELDTDPASVAQREASWPRPWVPGSHGYDSGNGGDHRDRHHRIKIDTKHNETPLPIIKDDDNG